MDREHNLRVSWHASVKAASGEDSGGYYRRKANVFETRCDIAIKEKASEILYYAGAQ